MPQYLKISYLQQNLVPFPKMMIPWVWFCCVESPEIVKLVRKNREMR